MSMPDAFHAAAVATFQHLLDTAGRDAVITLKSGDQREVRVWWRQPSQLSRGMYGMSIDGRSQMARLLYSDAVGVEKTCKLTTGGKTYTIIDPPDHGDLGVTTDLLLSESTQ